MSTSDNYVSPYLRRPLRSYDENLREKTKQQSGSRAKSEATTIGWHPDHSSTAEGPK